MSYVVKNAIVSTHMCKWWLCHEKAGEEICKSSSILQVKIVFVLGIFSDLTFFVCYRLVPSLYEIYQSHAHLLKDTSQLHVAYSK